jgi:3-hydroxy-9,10-secoandrosta-1,3,5(10)-triene-9,17-dione monooxygenase reductase component
MAVDPQALRAVMRHWATGVAILTARDGAQVHGMTVSSFASVSLEPPLVLVSVERAVRTHALVEHSRAFALSILCEGQEGISDRFAGRDSEQADRFEGLQTFTAVTGAPILNPNMGYLDCALAAAHDHGSHTIFVAEVVAAKMENVETPLVYFNRNYRKLTGG